LQRVSESSLIQPARGITIAKASRYQLYKHATNKTISKSITITRLYFSRRYDFV